MIDLTAFPGTPNTYFWSASPSANMTGYGWLVDMRGGLPYDGDVTIARRVRCVRGTPARAAPVVHFVVNADNTVTDTETGIVWQQQTSSDTFANQPNYCGSLGGAGWRAPHALELESIIDENRSGPTIDTAMFPGTASASYWTSSARADLGTDAWAIDFTNGTGISINKTMALPIRCLR
jgi:hypothetical protein